MKKGDCFRCSLAFLLGLANNEVPDFAETGTWEDLIKKNRNWLKEKDLDLLAFWFNGSWKLEDLLKWWSDYNPGRVAILHGWAEDDAHAVAIQDGKIVMNTCPSITLTSTKGYWFFYIVTPLRLG